MALEREKRNVAIGNMPYVRPSNVLGSLAKEVQQEAISRQKEIDTENENIEIAEKTALFLINQQKSRRNKNVQMHSYSVLN